MHPENSQLPKDAQFLGFERPLVIIHPKKGNLLGTNLYVMLQKTLRTYWKPHVLSHVNCRSHSHIWMRWLCSPMRPSPVTSKQF